MGTQTGVGVSHHRNPRRAGAEAASSALQAAGVAQPDFVFVFAAVGYQQAVLLEAVREVTQYAPLCGCSGEGIIVQDKHDESSFVVGVMVVRSDELRFVVGKAGHLKEDAQKAGVTIGQAVAPLVEADSLALLLFADGLTCNFDRLLSGIEQYLPSSSSLPILGGFAADNWAAQQTFQYVNGDIFSDGVAWALLSGDAQVASVVNHGCIPIGARRTITRCAGNVIFEIDDIPALDVFKEYLNDDELENWALTVANLCLGFKAPSYFAEYDEYLIRFLPAKDDTTGSVTIPTEVVEGTSVWFTRRDYEKIARGVEQMTEELVQQIGGQRPLLVLQFDCAGRGKAIFREEQKQQLLHVMQEGLGRDVPWLGFCTYGEIGPVGGHHCFHNYTAVLMAIYAKGDRG